MLALNIFAKCMLFGEHAVLRGGHALLIPIQSKSIYFSFEEKDKGFEFENCDQSSFKIDFQIDTLLKAACKLAGIKQEALKGRMTCRFHMPLGSGLGASAVISVGLGRLFAALGFIKKETIYSFACELEHFFHGQSSGADVAAVYYQKPILFKNRSEIEPFDICYKPNLYLSDTGSYGQTQYCIERVASLQTSNADKATLIDRHMIEATEAARLVFSEDPMDSKLSFDLMRQALQLGHSCFEDWGLVNHKVSAHVRELYMLGASAVKLTGAGDGGYVLSLWEDKPPQSGKVEFIKIFS